MEKIKRFGVSLEEDLLKSLDKLVTKHKFPNRSQLIRFLIRKNVVLQNWQHNKEVAGCVVLVYDHHKRDLMNNSVSLQHKYQDLVLSVQHVHLDHHNCLEMIALKGKAMRLKELADKLVALKGIKHGQLVMSGMGMVK
jgi:CopG family nickel-responsive transcriptional regulator